MISLQYEKITQALNYLLRKQSSNELNKINLIKLIWAADRYHIRNYGRLVTEDTYVAMPRGPVASLALDIVNENTSFLSDDYLPYSQSFIHQERNFKVKSVQDTDLDFLSESDMEALDFAWTKFGNIQRGIDLINFTHRYPEWKKFESMLLSVKTSVPIDPLDFFDNPEDSDEDPFELEEEILQENKGAFQRNNQVKSVLYL